MLDAEIVDSEKPLGKNVQNLVDPVAVLPTEIVTLIFSHLIYTLYNHHHFRSSPPPSRLLAEHRPHRRYWSPSRARRML